MNILIVGLVKNPQLTRLIDEGKKLGHKVVGCYTSELIIYSDNSVFEPTIRGENMNTFDLIYLWSVGKRRWEWYSACKYLNQKYRTVIINQKVIDPTYNYYLSPASDYLKQTQNKLPYPKSAIVFSEKSLKSISSKFEFPLIIKPSDGRQGRGVKLIKNKNEFENGVKELLKTVTSVVIREFIPNDGDIRVFTVGYKAIGAMKRIPKKGDFRSNISQGGSGENFDLTSYPFIKDLSEKMSKLTATEIAGVDIIIDKNTNKPYILEINPGPQFTGFEKYTGINVAREIIKYFENLHHSSK